MAARAIGYGRLPGHMREAARLYVERGIEPGGFMLAVLCNDMTTAFGRADAVNTAAMAEWAGWLVNDAPMGCWGSREKVERWIEMGGLAGKNGGAK